MSVTKIFCCWIFPKYSSCLSTYLFHHTLFKSWPQLFIVSVFLAAKLFMKTHGSESQGQEAACLCLLKPMQLVQWVIYMHSSSKICEHCSQGAITYRAWNNSQISDIFQTLGVDLYNYHTDLTCVQAIFNIIALISINVSDHFWVNFWTVVTLYWHVSGHFSVLISCSALRYYRPNTYWVLYQQCKEWMNWWHHSLEPTASNYMTTIH